MRALQGRAPKYVIEACLAAVGIQVRLAEGEMERDLLVRRQDGQILRQSLEPREMRARRCNFSVEYVVQQHRRLGGRDFDRLLERALRLREASERREQTTIFGQRDSIVRRKRDRLFIGSKRLLEASVTIERAAKLELGASVTRLERGRCPVLSERLLRPAEAAIERTQPQMSLVMLRVERHGLLIARQRLVPSPQRL